jgi:hypothetical protein
MSDVEIKYALIVDEAVQGWYRYGFNGSITIPQGGSIQFKSNQLSKS